MGTASTIEWTDATWNPVTGCTKVSAGCDNCYAHTLAHGRLHGVYSRQLPVVDTQANRADPFSVRLWPDRVDDPLRWSKPRMVFVNSMSDLFHVDVPEAFLIRIFEVMLYSRHIYQVLTKRPARAAAFLRKHFPNQLPAHIWIGTSIESQDVLYRVKQLGAINAAVRWLSCEPLLGPLSLHRRHDPDVRNWGPFDYVHWVVAGGESGAVRRPVNPDWIRSIRDQCVGAGVPFFFKQWGGRTPKAGGRELDGRTWDEYPTLQVPA